MTDIGDLARRAYALWADETLRRWLIERSLGRTTRAGAAQRHHPPYLPQADLRWEHPVTLDNHCFPSDRPVHDVQTRGAINLHGHDISYFVAAPSNRIFAESEDLEFTLAVHRFAWVPRHMARLSDLDLGRVWDWWLGEFMSRDDTWAWHPYTAGERMLNILDVLGTRRIDVVEQTLASCVNRHLDYIFKGLEYFGDATGNHLTNNGRALYRIGLAIGDERSIESGLTILRMETRRILDDHGFLREGSTHYQLLITQWLLDVWRSAARGARAEVDELAALALRALSASRYLVMGGGYPLFGDVSPDRCPADLSDLVLPDHMVATSWLARLPETDREAIRALEVPPPVGSSENAELEADWKKSRWADWTFLTHVPNNGWNPIPGHGHQDLTGFELHRNNEAVVIDPGRGRYGEMGESYFYRSALVHSVVAIDGLAPYPLNRALYSSEFRESVVGQTPVCVKEDEAGTWTLSHAGFSRLPGVGQAQRRWSHDAERDSIVIADDIAGTRSCTVTRRLITPLRTESGPNGVKLIGRTGSYLIAGEGTVSIRPLTIWTAYNEGQAGSSIEWAIKTILPFSSSLTISPSND